MSIIQFRDVSFSYHTGECDFPALKNVNLEISPGSFVLICGATGCGKSSLFRALNGLVPHFYEGQFTGQVLVNGKDTRQFSTRDLSLEVGLVFQNPDNQLIAMNVERELAFGPENLGLSREKIIAQVEYALDVVNIQHLRKKSPLELSGGEQQRVAIASVLALNPPILALDEPTANLDPQRALDILAFLSQLKHQGKTILIVEHRLELVLPLVDKMVVMQNGRIAVEGSVEFVLRSQDPAIDALELPPIVELFKYMEKTYPRFSDIPFTVEKASEILFAKKNEGFKV
ncbi:MAG: cobalt ABC transporter ATPase [Promethearchaeota archaeon CR_4]|nr:MAG: cobalt ABC transporter ATPase [Candidatus Lokiarchaeota archaeon CR_4]